MVFYILDHLIRIQQSHLLSASGTDVNLDYSLLSSFQSWVTFILRSSHLNGLILPPSVLLPVTPSFAFVCISTSFSLMLFLNSSSLSNWAPPPPYGKSLPGSSLEGWGVGDLFQDLFNQQMPTILQFYRHLLLRASPRTTSILPRSSVGGTSALLRCSLKREASSLTHLCKQQLQCFNSVASYGVKLPWKLLDSQWPSRLLLCLEYNTNASLGPNIKRLMKFYFIKP